MATGEGNVWTTCCTAVLARTLCRRTKRGQYEACVFYDASDTEPVYSLVHVDDIRLVVIASGHVKLRQIRGESFLVKDPENFSYDESKLDFRGRTWTRQGDEVHMQSSIGYIDGLLELRIRNYRYDCNEGPTRHGRRLVA